jgi:hypothetical protein
MQIGRAAILALFVATIPSQVAAQDSTTRYQAVSNPAGAAIFVDGGFVGNTEAALPLPPGTYRLVFFLENYAPCFRDLKVPSNGGMIPIRVALTPKEGAMRSDTPGECRSDVAGLGSVVAASVSGDQIAAALNRVGKPGSNNAFSIVAGVSQTDRDYSATLTLGLASTLDHTISDVRNALIQKAKDDLVALIRDHLTSHVCGFEIVAFWSPPAPADPIKVRLPQTCQALKSIDFENLVTQASALRAAVGSDTMDIVLATVTERLKTFPSFAKGSATAASLIRRVVANPKMVVSTEDLEPIIDAILNSSFEGLKKDKEYALAQVALTSAKVYIDLVRQHPDTPASLTEVVQKVIDTAKDDLCKRLTCPEWTDPTVMKTIFDWTNLGIRAVRALDANNKPDLRERMRAAIELTFSVWEKIPAATDTVPSWVLPWAHSTAMAAVDGNSMMLIRGITVFAAHALTEARTVPDAPEQARRTQKEERYARILSGVMTFALSVTDGSLADAREAQKAAFDAALRAAGERRNRAGEWVWSLGAGVGGIAGADRLRSALCSNSTCDKQPFDGRLHIPVGLTIQRLPTGWARGAHFMLTLADLGQYVGPVDTTKVPGATSNAVVDTSASGTSASPDWRSIISPGVEAGLILSKSPSHLFTVGVSWTHSPRFLDATPAAVTVTGPTGVQTTTATRRSWFSSDRFGVFVHYFIPIWPLN